MNECVENDKHTPDIAIKLLIIKPMSIGVI